MKLKILGGKGDMFLGLNAVKEIGDQVIMEQTVEVKVTLTFEAENEINEEGRAQLIEHVQNALEHWEWNGALCPRQIGGYTVSIEVDIE